MKNRIGLDLMFAVAVLAVAAGAAAISGCDRLGARETAAPSAEEAKAPAVPAAAPTAAPAAPVAVPPAGRRIGRLANGLRVIVREQHVGGVAAFRIYVGAGSLNEGDYTGAGVSHLLEHVVAGGSSTHRTEDQIRAALEAIGAQTNAHTSKQFVCYHGQTSGENIGGLIEIIADSVMNARLDQKEFDREHEVVQREIERSEADPDHRLWRLADETFFLSHPARYPVIGYLEAVKSLRREDLERYYRRIVVPDNAVAVAVGDFDAGAVYAKIEKVMGAWPRRPSEPTVLPPRDRQVAPRSAEAEMDVASVRTAIVFPTVQLTHPDLYPLDILAFVLGEGRASRLVSDLRDQRGLVQSVEVASETPAGYDGGEFAVVFEAEPAKAEAARQAVMEHLARAVREKVGDQELARAKRQKICEHVYSREQCESVASDMGANALLVGDPDFSQRYVQNIQRVTADDVQRVAAAYLRPDVVTVTTLRPKPPAPAKPEAAAAAPAPGGQVPAGTASRRPPVIARVLSNGVKLLLCPVEGHPTVSIQMCLRGGQSVEDEKTAGTSFFMSQLLLKGTAKHKTAEISEILDTMGAEMNVTGGRNTIALSAKCLAGDFEKTFDLAAECLLEPVFPPEEVERMRAQILASLAHMADTPHGEAALYFHRVFFRDSPYQFPVQGEPQVVKNLTRENLAAWHKRYVAGNNLVVAVFGGIDLVKAAHYAARAVENLPPNKDLRFPSDVPPRKVAAREVYVKPSQKEAALVYVAYPGMDIYNVRDRFAMDVLDTIMSGYRMPSGWLHEELRGKGLVYEVHAYSMEGLRPGYYAAYAVCQPEKAAEVVRIIEAAMVRAAREEFKEEELVPARATIITAQELGRETIEGYAFEATIDEALGLGYGFAREEMERIRQVRPEDVGRVARAYLTKPVIVVVTSDPAAVEAIRK